jgi:hypothetical protein
MDSGYKQRSFGRRSLASMLPVVAICACQGCHDVWLNSDALDIATTISFHKSIRTSFIANHEWRLFHSRTTAENESRVLGDGRSEIARFPDILSTLIRPFRCHTAVLDRGGRSNVLLRTMPLSEERYTTQGS